MTFPESTEHTVNSCIDTIPSVESGLKGNLFQSLDYLWIIQQKA